MNFLNYKINWFNLFKLALTSNDFRFHFKYTLAYAINNYEEKRGGHASDVLLFKVKYFDKIFSEKFSEK